MNFIKFSTKDINIINDLYWDNGFSQGDIADQFNCTQSTISRIVYSIYKPYDQKMAIKKKQCMKNIISLKSEPKQALTLRKKRETLKSTKLTWKQASLIRDQYFILHKTQIELANKFGLTQGTISKIIRGSIWKNI